mmetsp:Transcript_468/g.1322  ORF Transcript_468/g.1322 Transcript_468/m.1322 type:complete len:244 (+) Transcript_468:190-921(+)
MLSLHVWLYQGHGRAFGRLRSCPGSWDRRRGERRRHRSTRLSHLPHRRRTSYSATDAQHATLSEFLTPKTGTSTTASHSSITALSTPVTSLPSTMATPRPSSPSCGATPRGIASSVVSSATTYTPRERRCLTAAIVASKWSHGTDERAPSAVFSSLRSGGVVVKPHVTTRHTRVASAVRKIEPTFSADRRLSSTTVTLCRGRAARSSAWVASSTLRRSSLRRACSCRWRKATCCAISGALRRT